MPECTAAGHSADDSTGAVGRSRGGNPCRHSRRRPEHPGTRDPCLAMSSTRLMLSDIVLYLACDISCTHINPPVLPYTSTYLHICPHTPTCPHILPYILIHPNTPLYTRVPHHTTYTTRWSRKYPCMRPFTGGFQGYCLKDIVKGPQFEETETQLFVNQKFVEESQNES